MRHYQSKMIAPFCMCRASTSTYPRRNEGDANAGAIFCGFGGCEKGGFFIIQTVGTVRGDTQGARVNGQDMQNLQKMSFMKKVVMVVIILFFRFITFC
jgi:hypothetical protein